MTQALINTRSKFDYYNNLIIRQQVFGILRFMMFSYLKILSQSQPKNIQS